MVYSITHDPWINSTNELYAEGMIDETRVDVCMGHLEINGFQMSKNMSVHKVVVKKNSLESLIQL